jgi:hypothetical protein
MADRDVHQARHDSNGDVTALGNPQAYWSPRLKQDVINDIESGLHTYYVPWRNDPHTPIRVVNGPYGKYLRSDRDNTERNNLDDLPEC